jgi:hypothetical protein
MYTVIDETAKLNWQIDKPVSLKELQEAIKAFGLSHQDEMSQERIDHSIEVYLKDGIIQKLKKDV